MKPPKISAKYQAALSRYLEWERCTTPLGSHAARYVRTGFPSGELSAGEAMMSYETHGTVCGVKQNDAELASRYLAGKANRDWWTKEIGWWERHAAFVREEFLVNLMPLCFIEVFGVQPFTPRVRFQFDNFYTPADFERDMSMASKGFEVVASGVIMLREEAGCAA